MLHNKIKLLFEIFYMDYTNYIFKEYKEFKELLSKKMWKTLSKKDLTEEWNSKH